jgi:WD40 repeat protein
MQTLDKDDDASTKPARSCSPPTQQSPRPHPRGAGVGSCPDGSWLASTGDDGEVRIWDLAIGTARHTLTGHTYQVAALAVASDGSWLASTGDDGEVRIWDPISGAALTSLRVAGGLS